LVGDKFVEGYGLTETVGGGCATTPADYHPGCLSDDIYASVGRPQPSTFARILDENGQDIPPGSDEVGEVQYECETLFSGYWNRPEETAEVFDGRAFLTGDLARRDAAGYVYVVGRKKELIISGGQNIYPAELERVLAGMEGVAQSAIFGVDHPKWGETVAAAVVPKPDTDIDEQAVIDYMRSRLASYKKPTRVLILDALPMNAGMKVQKGRLREIAERPGQPDPSR
jgi:fatty-acyl-CoA synthase